MESPFELSEKGIENTIDPVPFYPITIEKKGKVLEILNDFIESDRKMSPTALDQYVQCPLSYYFKYIARIEEEEEVTDEVDARMFGTLFHAVMENLYQPLLNKTIVESSLKAMLDGEQEIEKVLYEAFAIHFFKRTG